MAQETDPGFQVIQAIPDMYQVTSDQLFVSQGEYELFKEFYLDGKKLTRGEEYTAESGSTRITVFSQVLRALGTGEHTAAATFVVHKKDGTSQTKVSSQNFSTGVQPVRSSGGGGGGGSSGYAITLKQTAGGTVKASTLSARSGATVTLTLTPNTGYEVKSVSVTGTNVAGDVSVSRNGNQYTFTMPGKQVTVTPTFTRSALRVAPVSVEHGKLTVSRSNAVPGASVTITAHPDNGYVAVAFSAWDKDGKYLTVKDNGDGTASFTMPDSPVQVGARFDLDPGLPVTDISKENWFYEDARWAYRRGILMGVTGTSWVPEDRMSSATAVVTLARLAGADLTEYQDENWTFREDSGSYGWIPSDWYTAEARWAAVNHILTEDIFTAREALPRAYLAVMFRRFLTQQGVVADVPSEQAAFSDADAVRTFGAEAEESFQILYQADVFRGDSSKAMLPGAYTKRSHLAATLHRLSDYIIGYWEARQAGEQEENA